MPQKSITTRFHATRTTVFNEKFWNSFVAEIENAIQSVADSLNRASGIGVGQTLQNMSASREIDVDYQNNTGRAIHVSIFAQAVGSAFTISVSANGADWSPVYIGQSDAPAYASIIIPDGWHYRCQRISGDTSPVLQWFEMR